MGCQPLASHSTAPVLLPWLVFSVEWCWAEPGAEARSVVRQRKRLCVFCHLPVKLVSQSALLCWSVWQAAAEHCLRLLASHPMCLLSGGSELCSTFVCGCAQRNKTQKGSCCFRGSQQQLCWLELRVLRNHSLHDTWCTVRGGHFSGCLVLAWCFSVGPDLFMFQYHFCVSKYHFVMIRLF